MKYAIWSYTIGVWSELLEGLFLTQKALNNFFMMAHDQLHDHAGEFSFERWQWGIGNYWKWISLVLQCWMIVPRNGLDQEISVKHSPKLKCTYHEQIPSSQARFVTNVRSVVDACLNEMGNPFTETNSDFLAINTKMIMADEVIQILKKVEDLRNVQYKAFVDECLAKITNLIYISICHRTN